jgi:hypothetical protein
MSLRNKQTWNFQALFQTALPNALYFITGGMEIDIWFESTFNVTINMPKFHQILSIDSIPSTHINKREFCHDQFRQGILTFDSIILNLEIVSFLCYTHTRSLSFLIYAKDQGTFFCNPILFAVCTSTFSKLSKKRIQWHNRFRAFCGFWE